MGKNALSIKEDNNSERLIKKFNFDKGYETYGEIWGRGPSAAAVSLVKSKILRKKCSILDLGCGYGRDCKYFAEKGFMVTGIDWSSRAIRLGISMRPNGLFYNLVCMDFHLFLKNTRRKWDCVFATYTFTHLCEKPRLSIYEYIWKCLRSKGIFCLAEISTKDTCYERYRKLGEDNSWEDSRGLFTHFFTKQEIIRSLRPLFKIIKIIQIKDTHRSNRILKCLHTHSVLFCTARKL